MKNEQMEKLASTKLTCKELNYLYKIVVIEDDSITKVIKVKRHFNSILLAELDHLHEDYDFVRVVETKLAIYLIC